MNLENPEANRVTREDKMVAELEQLGATVSKEKNEVGTYVLSFDFGEAVTTMRIGLRDLESNADLLITAMTTLPENETGKGWGSRAIEILLRWAKANNLTDILAVQVQDAAEGFWQKNGFEKIPEPNPTNDFVYRKE